MTNLDDSDKEFRETFLEHLKLHSNRQLDRRTRSKDRPKIRQMIEEKQVSRMTVITSIIEAQKMYPDELDYIFHGLLRGIYNMPDSYPELMWFVDASGLLLKRDTVEDMFDIAQLLVTIVGHKLARNYLNYLVLISPKEASKIIIPAYYYTHHDIESLRLVFPFMSDDDLNLSDKICTSAVMFLFSQSKPPLAQEDINFLISLFEKGLEMNLGSARMYYQESLAKLKEE